MIAQVRPSDLAKWLQSVRVHGEPVDSDFFRLGFGMSFVFTHGRSGFFYYERLLGRDRITQNNLALGLRLEF